MSVLDRFKNRGGGGFLNNVDGTITEFIWTSARPEPPKGSTKKRPAIGKSKTQDADARPPLFARISVQADGAETIVQRSLRAGYGDEWKISKDGHTLTPLSEESELWGGAEFMQFLYTVEGLDYDVTQLGSFDPGDPIDLSPLEDERFRFIQKVDDEKTAKLGKRTYTSKKTGKDVEADWTYLAVSKYYGEGDSTDRPTQTTTSRSSSTGVAKPNGAAHDDDDQDTIASLAHETLYAILGGAKNNTIKFNDLKLKVTTALMGNPLRNPVRTYLENEENLLSIPNVTYDQTSKTREISLDA